MDANPEQETAESLSPELVYKFLEIQSEEVRLRAEEVIIRKQREVEQASIAKLSIGAQERDRQDERAFQKGRLRDLLWFSSFVLVVVIAAVVLLANWGKEVLIADILKFGSYVLVAAVSAYGGYKVGAAKGKSENITDASD